MNTTNTIRMPLTVLVIAVAALAGCNKHDDRTAGQKLDSAIATTEQTAQEAKANAKEGIENIKQSSSEMSAESKQKAEVTGQKIETNVTDATITAKVTAGLIADSELKSSKINVDTQNGVVTLTGEAPTAQAVLRATDLVKAMSGVGKVNNMLVVHAS